MRIDKLVLLLSLACTTGSAAFAGEHRQHGAHEHGVGRLNIAQDGSEVHLELDTPAVNIVGFEHAPRTEADHDALEKALARLKDGGGLFLFPEAAGCRLADADVATSLLAHEDDEEEHHAGHGHHRNEPSHHDAEEHDEEHDAHEGHDEHGGETHADITAAYRFSCAKPEELDQVIVRQFEAFPLTERLRVQLITGKDQGAAELTASQPILRF